MRDRSGFNQHTKWGKDRERKKPSKEGEPTPSEDECICTSIAPH